MNNLYISIKKKIQKLGAFVLFFLVFLQYGNAQCTAPGDTVCVDVLDTLFIYSDPAFTSYNWYTNHGATLTVLPGDTMVSIDWSTSSILNAIDSVCVVGTDASSCKDTLCISTYLKDCCTSPTMPLTLKRLGAPTICEILAADPTHPIGAADCDGGGFDNLTECQNGTNPEDSSDDVTPCTTPVPAGIGIYSLSIQNGENETPVLPIVVYLEKDPNGTTDNSTWVFSGTANFAYTTGVSGQGQTNFTDGAFHYNVLNGNMSHGSPFEIQSAHFFSGGNGALTDKEGSQLTRVKSGSGGQATACGQCPTDIVLEVAAKGAALTNIAAMTTSFYYTIDGGAPISLPTFTPPSVNEVPQTVTLTCPGVGICQDIEFIQETTYEYTDGTAVSPSPVVTYQKVEVCWGQ